MSVGLGEIVRVVNKDSKDWTVGWNNRFYHLEPEKDVFLPFECVMLAFGDPRSGAKVEALTEEGGTVQFIADRATEVRRLRAKYDHQGGDETRFDPSRVPSVEVFTLEGERVLTVLDDPDGTSVMQAETTVSDQANLHAMLVAQQKQIEQLMGQTSETPTPEQAEPKPESDVELPQDTSEVVTPQPTYGSEKINPPANSPSIDFGSLNAGRS